MNDDLKARTLKVLSLAEASWPLEYDGVVWDKSSAPFVAIVRELLAEVDALEKDARRYEFLRDGPLPFGILFSVSTKLLKFKGGGAEAIDKAIDEALSQGEPRG